MDKAALRAHALRIVVGVWIVAGTGVACRRESRHSVAGALTPVSVAGAPAGMRFVSDVPNGDWPMPAGDYGNLRYSALDAINTTNAANLRVITTFSTGIANGHEGQPLVVNDTMYVVTPFPNNLIAVDLHNPTGETKWIYEPHPDSRAVGSRAATWSIAAPRTPPARSFTTSSTLTPSRWMPPPVQKCGERRSATSTSAKRSPARRLS